MKTEGSIIVFSPEDVDGDAEEDDEDEPDDDQSEHPVAQDPAVWKIKGTVNTEYSQRWS